MSKTQTAQTEEVRSKFHGGMLGLIGISLLWLLIVVCTLTIGTAWANCMYYRWYAKHTEIDGKRLTFDGKGIQLFGNYIKWFWLTVITLGIYGLWVGIKFEKWKVKHTHFKAEEVQAETNAPAQAQPVYAANPYLPQPQPQAQMPTQPQCQPQFQPAFPPFPFYPYPYPYPQMPPYGCPHAPQNGTNEQNKQ